MREPADDVFSRVVVAVAAATAVAFVAAFVAVSVFRARHFGCDYAVGGEAGDGTWLCPDGIAYFLPTTAVAGAAGGLVLLGYLAWEVRGASPADLRKLSLAATLLGSGVVALNGLLLLGIGAPLWLAAPFLVVAGGVAAVRRSPSRVFTPLVGGAAALSAVSVVFLLTAPAAVAAAAAWVGALALRAVAERRSSRATGVMAAEVRSAAGCRGPCRARSRRDAAGSSGRRAARAPRPSRS